MTNQKQTLSEQTEHEIGVLFSEAVKTVKEMHPALNKETEVPAAIETLEEKITDLVSKLFSVKKVTQMLDDMSGDEQVEVLTEFAISSEQMIERLAGEGYTVLKTESLADRNALEDFVRSAIYPYNVNHLAGEGAFA